MSAAPGEEQRPPVYVLAQNIKEATELRNLGFGYDSRSEAMKARSHPAIDPFYRNLMKVYELESISDNDIAALEKLRRPNDCAR